MTEVIKLKNINKSFELKDEKIKALKNVNLSFEDNMFYAIKGHSGSGKSTLISILGLIDKATSGTYLLNNEDINNMSDDKLSTLRMKNIGFVFQSFNLEENLTAIENVCIPMLINKDIKIKDRKNNAIKLLGDLGLKDRLNHKPKELSGGEQQRVCIARALANDPKILLCDEPTGNLDRKNEKIVFDMLKELSKKGKCIIVVSHSNDVDKYADKIIKINEGIITK